MREDDTLENVVEERPNAAKATTPLRIFVQNNPLTQPGVYERGFSFNRGLRGIMQFPVGMNGNKGQQVPQQPFRQPTSVLYLGAIREALHELYGPGLKKISRPEF